jgi:hypothetical protein
MIPCLASWEAASGIGAKIAPSMAPGSAETKGGANMVQTGFDRHVLIR